jgi:hypothetical protein
VHTYPIVLVHAETAEEAKELVTSWVDTQFEENGQRVYDYGGVVSEDRVEEEDKDKICLPASEVVDRVKSHVTTEENAAKQNWAILKSFVEAYKGHDLPPAKFNAKETFSVSYTLAIGIQHLVKAGTEVKRDNYPASLGLYNASKLAHMFDHWGEDRERFTTTDACLYTIDTESQEALNTGKWDGIWAVVCDFHY